MENKLTFDFNDKKFQELSVAIMNDIVTNDYKRDTFDEMYETMCKYVQITKEQFEEYYKLAESKIKEYLDSHELSEEELDSVVGGSWYGSIWKWTKDHAVTIGVVAAGVAIIAVTGGIAGAAIGAGMASAFGMGVTAAAGAAQGAAMFAATWGVGGALVGIDKIARNAYKNGFHNINQISD